MAIVEARASAAPPTRVLRLETLRRVAWVVLLGSVGWVAGTEAELTDLPEGVRAVYDIPYRESAGSSCKLDLYQPEGPAPAGGRPAVVAIHGGGWRGGSKRGHGRMVARMAQHGYVVLAPGYTLARPERPSWPANFEDVRESIRWIRRHAAELGVDSRRIAVVGASAGGHLAAMLGTYPDTRVEPEAIPAGIDTAAAPPHDGVSARVQAVVSFYGPADLLTNAQASGPARSMIRVFLGGDPDAFPDRYRAASPISHLSGDDAPMFLVHGTNDDSVPLDQSAALAQRAESAGVRCRRVVVEGAGHGFGLHVGGRDLLPEILAFLDETWTRPRSRGTFGPERSERVINSD